MADDRLTAALEEIRERYAKAGPGLASNPVVYIDSADDVPRLLDALDFLLAAHSASVTAAERDRLAAILRGEAGA